MSARDPFDGRLDAKRRELLRHLAKRGGHFTSHAEVRAMRAHGAHLAILEVAVVEGGQITDAHRSVGRGKTPVAAMEAALSAMLEQVRAERAPV